MNRMPKKSHEYFIEKPYEMWIRNAIRRRRQSWKCNDFQRF